MTTLFSQMMEQASRGFVSVLPFIIIASAVMMIYKIIHDKWSPYHDDQQLAAGNIAVAWSRGCAYLGILIGLVGSFIGAHNRTYIESIAMFAVDGVFIVGVSLIAYLAFDYVIVRATNNWLHIQKGNVAVGVTQGAGSLSVGLVTSASFAGGGQGFWPGIGSATLYSGLGVLSLSVAYVCYDLFWSRRGYGIDKRITNGEIAPAIDAGLFILAMAVVQFFSICGDFAGWLEDFASYVMAVLTSVLVVPIGRFVACHTLARKLPNDSATQSLIVGLCGVGFAFLVGMWQFTS